MTEQTTGKRADDLRVAAREAAYEAQVKWGCGPPDNRTLSEFIADEVLRVVATAGTDARTASPFLHLTGYDIMRVERPRRLRIVKCINHAGWWLFHYRWPRRPISKAVEPKQRLADWLLAITDDRPGPARHRGGAVAFWRCVLGVMDRPTHRPGAPSLIRRDSDLGRRLVQYDRTSDG